MKSYRILFVCMGNICRSPAGEAVLRKLAEDEALLSKLEAGDGGEADDLKNRMRQALHARISTKRALDKCREKCEILYRCPRQLRRYGGLGKSISELQVEGLQCECSEGPLQLFMRPCRFSSKLWPHPLQHRHLCTVPVI